MQELDIRTAVLVLFEKLKWIFLVAIIGGALLGSYTKFMVADTYQSSCSFYVMNISKAENNQSISSGTLVASRALVQDYMAILKTSKVINQVSAALNQNGYRMTNGAILRTINMQSNEDTSLLKVTVTTSNPQLSKAVCDALAQAAPKAIKEVMMGMGSIAILDNAQTGVRVGPNVARNVVIGGLAGFVLSYGLFLVLHLLDNTVHDEHELKNRLNVTVLGSVPTLDNVRAKKGGKNHGR